MSTTDDDYSAEDLAALTDEMEIEDKARDLRILDRARALNAARNVPPLALSTASEFLADDGTEWLVDDLFHVDSLARLFGPAGGGKTFVSLDVALSVAAGLSWRGAPVTRRPVYFVMAEGKRANVERVRAWCAHHRADPASLDGWFHPVTRAVLLTEPGVAELAAEVGRTRPGLIALDTKNAMMDGDENSAADVAKMRRALDELRYAAGGACVLLIDHTGHGEAQRARGSSAVTAAMDDEVRVARLTDGRVAAQVTRSKSGEAGKRWVWDLTPAAPSAVLTASRAPVQDEDAPDDEALGPAWKVSLRTEVTEAVNGYRGRGKDAFTDLARLMSYAAAPSYGDPDGVGISRSEAVRELKQHTKHSERAVGYAWSGMRAASLIRPVGGESSESTTGRHVWAGEGGWTDE